MRQWNVPPKKMCRQHLLGEHFEIHIFASALRKRKCLDGFLVNGLLETHTLRRRHKALVQEMKRRGYKHKTPLPLFPRIRLGLINVKENIRELARRCKECRSLQKGRR
jgi:hypothetical protein